MKLRKNDLIELRKGGKAMLETKLGELKTAYLKVENARLHNELKNLREPSLIRRSIAKVMTIIAELKETK